MSSKRESTSSSHNGWIKEDLINCWFKNISRDPTKYKEPILDSFNVKFIKEICEIFEQPTNVFILTIEVAEDYLRAKQVQNKIISDWILCVVTITFISHKSYGSQDSLNTQHLINILFHFTKTIYSSNDILAMEMDVLCTLNGRIPITSSVDDLDVIIQVHFNKWRLKVSIRDLCLQLLELLYIERLEWFSELKEFYDYYESNGRMIFRSVMESKSFIPVSVLLSALRMTNYNEIMQMDSILKDMSTYCAIHPEHIKILSLKLMQLVNPN